MEEVSVVIDVVVSDVVEVSELLLQEKNIAIDTTAVVDKMIFFIKCFCG
jgi:hypothetical protein